MESPQTPSSQFTPAPAAAVNLQAELADRDFTAERYQPVVVGSSAHNALSEAESAAVRAQAEARAADKVCLYNATPPRCLMAPDTYP
jgi:hypothetical protein